MRLHRFYVQKPLGEEILKVENVNIIHQLVSVFRYKESNEVIFFSDDGYDYTYSISSLSKKEISFVLKDKKKGIILNKDITLYMSLVKKDTFENIVRYCTELGVTRFVPIISERSEKKNLNEERLKIIATEATEQCGRNNIPVISPIISLEEALKVAENVVVASLFGNDIKNKETQKSLENKEISIFVGPEGGWTDREEKVFEENNLTKIKLTNTVLKADTAATSVSAIAILL